MADYGPEGAAAIKILQTHVIWKDGLVVVTKEALAMALQTDLCICCLGFVISNIKVNSS